MEPSRRRRLADAVAEAAAEVHELRGVAASAARLVREHQHSQQRAVSRRLLTVLLVYRITGHMGWCMMAAKALGIAELYVAGTGTEVSPPQPELPFLGADMWEPRAARLLTLWAAPLPVEKAGRLIGELRVLGFLAEANARGVAVSTPHGVAAEGVAFGGTGSSSRKVPLALASFATCPGSLGQTTMGRGGGDCL